MVGCPREPVKTQLIRMKAWNTEGEVIMTQCRVWLCAVFIMGLCAWSCADADDDMRNNDTKTDMDSDADTDSDSDSDTDTDGDGDADGDADGDTDTDTDVDTDSDTGVDRDCTLETGVYEYCNNGTPCSCGNLCGKDIILGTSAVTYKPVGSFCLAECDLSKNDEDCPNAWEQCGKMKNSDPQAFCMPFGTVSGNWQARIFEDTVDFSNELTVAEHYLVDNNGITVDVGWWNPKPSFTKGLIHYGTPENATGKYYILSLTPEKNIEYDNVVEQWMFDVYVPEENWGAGSIVLTQDPGAFSVQPMLLRIVKPTVSMRTWMHGAIRTSSTFTIDNPGQLCTDLENTENCALASGSFKIDFFGLSGTLEEQ